MQLRSQLLLVTSAAVILTGCNRLLPGKNQPNSPAAMQQEANEIAQAMQQGKPLACVITNTEDQSAMAYAIEGQKMKVTGMRAEGQTQAGSMLNDGEFLYVWDEATLQGTKMMMPDPAEVAKSQEQAEQYLQELPDFSDTTVQESYEEQGYTIECQPGNFPADFFTPPSNVTFQDLSQLMESFGSMTGEAMMETEAAANPTLPSGLSEEQQQALENAMQQLGQ